MIQPSRRRPGDVTPRDVGRTVAPDRSSAAPARLAIATGATSHGGMSSMSTQDPNGASAEPAAHMTGLGKPLFVAHIRSVKGAPASVKETLTGLAWSDSTSMFEVSR